MFEVWQCKEIDRCIFIGSLEPKGSKSVARSVSIQIYMEENPILMWVCSIESMKNLLSSGLTENVVTDSQFRVILSLIDRFIAEWDMLYDELI